MDKNNPTYKIIKLEFETLSRAQRLLGFKSRQSIYDIIEFGGVPSTRSKNIIIASGYDPVTFKPVAHVEE